MVLPQVLIDNIDRLALAATGPIITMLELPPNMSAPTIATIRELDLVADANMIEAKFSAANYEVDVASYGGIGEVVRRLHNNRIPLNQPGTVKRPYDSKLSLQNKKYCYVIFKLKAKNWQFAHDSDPFTLGFQSIDPEVYYAPRKANERGEIQDRGKEVMGSRIALFIADGARAYEDVDSYIDPFNYHLELIDTNSNGQPSLVPIVIDPDVRYPGGSGLDGEGP